MIETHEPKDGDFIAYIEQLQKESAARVLGAQHSLNLDTASAASTSKAGSHFFAGRAPDFRGAASDAARMQVARASLGRLLAAALAIIVGVALTFYWLLASATLIVLAIGIALVLWGVQQIKRAAQRISALQTQRAEALVSKAFGASHTKTK